MPFSNTKIHMIVPWRNCHHACSEFRINHIILDNSGGYLSIDPFAFKRITVFVLRITLIIRMHDNIFVTEFSFRTYRADLEWAVLKSEKRGISIFAFHFIIGNIGFKVRVPIDDTWSAENQTIFIHPFKSLIHTTVKLRIHRVALSAPVTT